MYTQLREVSSDVQPSPPPIPLAAAAAKPRIDAAAIASPFAKKLPAYVSHLLPYLIYHTLFINLSLDIKKKSKPSFFQFAASSCEKTTNALELLPALFRAHPLITRTFGIFQGEEKHPFNRDRQTKKSQAL